APHEQWGGEARQRRISIVGGIRDLEPQVCTPMLPDELALEGEREAATTGFEQDAFTTYGFGAFPPASQVQRHPVPRLDDVPIGDRAELRDRLAQRLEHALHVLFADNRGGTYDVESTDVGEHDLQADVDRGRVPERLARRQHVGVDLR